MQYRIATGQLVNIEVGMKVTIDKDYLPSGLTSLDQLSVIEVTTDYPFINFYKDETVLVGEDQTELVVKIDEVSAVTPVLILEVIP